jgi:hypothetical protein
MGFFDDVPPGLDRPGTGSCWHPPVGELPCVAASALLLTRTETVAVAITAVWAFSTGFEFWVKAEFRHEGHSLETRPDVQSLHIGVQYPDGRKVANTGRLPAPAGSESAGLILSPVSFGGGRRHLDRSYWVWPLPPAGPLTFACEWAAFGIPEARAGTDAQPILDAARHSVQLWPLADP